LKDCKLEKVIHGEEMDELAVVDLLGLGGQKTVN